MKWFLFVFRCLPKNVYVCHAVQLLDYNSWPKRSIESLSGISKVFLTRHLFKVLSSGVKSVIIIKCRTFRNSSDVMSLSQISNNLNTSETSETMEAASLKEPSSSLESTRPFPEILDVNGFSKINLTLNLIKWLKNDVKCQMSTFDVNGNLYVEGDWG